MGFIHSVILVDDDRINNFLNVRLLRRLKICKEVYSFEDGKKALDFLRNIPDASLPAYVLLDYDMPEMDGKEFIENFNNSNLPHREKMKISLLTHSRKKQLKEMFQDTGIEYIVNKPLTNDKALLVMFDSSLLLVN